MRIKGLLGTTCLCVGLFGGHIAAAEQLTLGDAANRTLTQNPFLNVYKLQDEALNARRETASLRPPLEFGIEVENFAGSGVTQGFDEAEITVSLSSVIELGSKRSARIALMDSKAGKLRAELQSGALDVLGGMTSQFITALALREQLSLAQESSALASRTSLTVQQRVEAGVAADAELLRSQALESQAKIAAERVSHQLDVAIVGLGVFWGSRERTPYDVEGDLFHFGQDKTFPELWELVASSPAVRVFASEERLKDAEIQLAESRSRLDIRWSLGVRRLEGIDENALVGSLQIPLFSGRRNRGELAAFRSERAEIEVRREQSLNVLYARLYDAYATRAQSIAAVQTLADETIPALTSALKETQSAYDAGLYSYLELIAAQRALIDAKQTHIATAANALQAAVVIEQLTGIPLQPGTDAGHTLQETLR